MALENYGEETRVFLIHSIFNDKFILNVNIKYPLRQSIQDYLYDYQNKLSPLHMCLLEEEMLEFNACMENLRAMEFKGRPRMLYKVYRQTLAEHNLNIYKEMENASL